MNNNKLHIASEDILAGLKRYDLVGMLGWQDIHQRYRRSVIGPFWLTISTAVMIGMIGFIFGTIFKAPMDEFLPYLAVGLITWTYMSTCIQEGCTTFTASESIIKQLRLPLFIHVLRILWRNMIIYCHNLIILPVVYLILGKSIGGIIFLAIPGLLLLTINLAWMALFLGIVCTRYRDMSQIVNSLIQVLFYITPIIWMPSLMAHRPGANAFLINLNPVYHLISIVRIPLLGAYPSALNWLVSIFIAIIGWGVTLLIYSRFKKRIAYWL